MGDKQIVVAIFPDEAAADTAAQSLKDWDKLDDDVKLNAIGVLVLDEDGKVKTQKIGKRSWGKGAGIGVVLAVAHARHAVRRSPRRRRARRTPPQGTRGRQRRARRDLQGAVGTAGRRSGRWSRRPRRLRCPTSSRSSAVSPRC